MRKVGITIRVKDGMWVAEGPDGVLVFGPFQRQAEVKEAVYEFNGRMRDLAHVLFVYSTHPVDGRTGRSRT